MSGAAAQAQPAGAPPVRDAATLILLRGGRRAPAVLMGQRGAGAAFMPMKFVFPGGAVDPGDAAVPLAGALDPACRARLMAESCGPSPEALAAAAVRELWEETGLVLGARGTWRGPVPPGWAGFAATGHLPLASALGFVFRAITPPGRPRRFDARFFLADAAAVAGDPDDFSRAAGELQHLRWVPLDEARGIDLPFITSVVLAEIAARLGGAQAPGVPFFRNDAAGSQFCWL
ncbi:MAG: NUDIX hydrolase [Rhodobacteraceae bacterium]|nr:NUDIX hydrolase [Paracoccaceae bacterium]